MAEFQEENLFKGAAQSQGFAPMQAPDTSQFLRENMGQIDRNFANIQSQQQAQNEADLKRKIQTYEALGKFAPSFMQIAKTLGEAYITNQMIEGNAKTRSLGKEFNFGISPEQQVQNDATLEALKDEDAAFSRAASEAGKQKEPMEAINYIKQLPQYQRIVGMKNYLANRQAGYSNYLKQFLQNDAVRLPKPAELGGGTFTPSEINHNPVLASIAVNQAARLYDIETGVENFSKSALVGYNDAINKVNSGAIQFSRDQDNLRTSAAIRSQRIEAFEQDGDLNALVSGINGTYETKDKMYGFKESLDLIFEKIIPSLYQKGMSRVQLFGPDGDGKGGILGQIASGDPTGKRSYYEFYDVRVGELEEELIKIDKNRRSELKGQRDDLNRQVLEIGLDYFRNQWKGDVAQGLQFIDQLQLRAPEADLSALKVFTGIAKKQINGKFWDDELAEREQNFTLSSSLLNDPTIPQIQREAYQQKARQQDEIRARFELTDAQLRNELSTELRESLGKTSLDTTSSGLQSATSAAVRAVQQNLYRQFLTKQPEEISQSEALAAVRKQILEKKGDFAVTSYEEAAAADGTNNYFPAFTPKTTATPKGQMATAESFDRDYQLDSYRKDPSIIKKIPMVPVANLQQLAADVRMGKTPEVPGIYRTLYNTNNGGYNTLADFVNANLQAAGVNERITPTHTDRLKVRTVDPGIQKFLDRADTVTGLQMGQALATPGATRDPRFMNPAVAQAVARNPNPMPNPGGRLSKWASTSLSPEEQALLRTIRYAEGTDNAAGYNTMFTYKQFSDMSQHPRIINRSGKLASDAAGAYQYLSTTWQPYADGLKITDFTEESQDKVAHHHLKKLGVNPKELLTREMINKLSGTWASFPTLKTGTSAYGQGGKSFDQLLRYYSNALTEIRGY